MNGYRGRAFLCARVRSGSVASARRGCYPFDADRITGRRMAWSAASATATSPCRQAGAFATLILWEEEDVKNRSATTILGNKRHQAN